MACESNAVADAVGGNNYGLFQLSSIHAAKWPGFWESWAIPAWNIAHAYELWSVQGWLPWGCRP